MDAVERDVRVYRSPDRHVPFIEWLDALRDERARQKIQARIARLRLGNPGQIRPVGDGVLELKVDFGPGYRVYFGQDGPRIVILLCGGNKSTQSADVKKAKTYWAQYKQEQSHGQR